MQIYRENNKKGYMLLVFFLSLFIIISSVQGIIKIESSNPNLSLCDKNSEIIGEIFRDSTFEWNDEFLDTNNIDDSLSYNCYVDVTNGIVKMDNTYEAWGAYPEWQRMKTILITNSGDDSLDDYIIDLTVNYDSDMQADFDDIRFADENGFPLTYWMGDVVLTVSADFLVRLPQLPSQQTTTIYMFYKNPLVDDESDDTIFTWGEITDEDLRLSWTLYTEGAWDPGVSYGGDKFIVAWEEGVGPGYSSDFSHRFLQRQIHVRLLDTDGTNPIPPYPDDIDISTASGQSYHAEDPSIAFSEDSGKFLVVWNENPTLYRYAIGIKGALISTSGVDYSPFTIHDPLYSGLNYYPCLDPCVAYDEFSNRFFVVYTKTDSNWNYDVLGKFYGANGGQVGSTVYIGTGSDYQGQPWVCSDNLGHFMVVYEEGNGPVNGPFDLKARLYEYDGVPVGGVIDVAVGSSSLDNIYPSVCFNDMSEEYLITWNTGDASIDDYNGLIDGMLLNDIGSPIETFTIQSGSVYKISNPVAYLGSRFFVTYEDDYSNLNSIWGRLVNSDGNVISYRPELSDDLDFNKQYANSASGGGNVFVAWEDDRLDFNNPPTEVRGSIWNCPQSTDSLDVSYGFGDEKNLIIEAKLVSILIEPEDFIEWKKFYANVTYVPQTSIDFDILDSTGTIVLMQDISPGEDLINVTNNSIRLQARFSRIDATNTSVLDSWGVTALVGSDIQPPWTDIILDPEFPNGENDWYVSPIDLNMVAYDNDSAAENVTTYYKINDGDVEIYEPGSVVELSIEGINNSFEYWSMDIAGNEELPHNIITDIKIDLTSPFITILGPPELVFPGEIHVNGTINEYGSGSGLDRMFIKINNEIVYNETIFGGTIYWFDYMFTADYGEQYDIFVQAYDSAGNSIISRKTVTCSERGIYITGYFYFVDNPKIGPLNILELLDMAIAIDYDSLYVVLPDFDSDAVSVKFMARNINRGNEFSSYDNNLSDGCSAELQLSRLGSYEIKAYAYDKDDVLLDEYLIISKMFTVILSS